MILDYKDVCRNEQLECLIQMAEHHRERVPSLKSITFQMHLIYLLYFLCGTPCVNRMHRIDGRAMLIIMYKSIIVMIESTVPLHYLFKCVHKIARTAL